MLGLSFLNTLFLWGLAAASLPIIIHLIRRNRAVKVPFAATRFLEASPKKILRHQRLRQLLLLLMRILVLVLLALAFARPFLEKTPAVGLLAETPKAVAVLLDHSLSMTADDRLQQAAAEAKKILQSTRPGDFVTVIRFTGSSEVLVEEADNPQSLSSAVSSWLEPSFGSTGYRQALQTAENLLQRSFFPDKIIYLISDFEGSPERIEGDSYRLAPGIRLKAIPVRTKRSVNAAITAVSLPKDSDAEKAILAQVRVTGKPGPRRRKRLNARLVIGGKVVERQQVKIKENGEGVARFTRLPKQAGTITGYVEIDPLKGSVSGDDRFYFVLRGRAKVRILAVDGEPENRANRDELFFVDRAFNLHGDSPFKLETAYPTQLSKKNLTDYQVVLLANVKTLSSDAVKRLEYFVRTGGGLLITLGDQINPTYFNRALAELLPGTLVERRFGVMSRVRSVLLAQVEYYHPIFRAFEDPGHGDLASAHFYQYYQVTPSHDSEVLAGFDDGGPALLERAVGEGRVLLFTSTIDNEWNDLPVKPLFLPLLYQVAHHLAPEEGEQTEIVVDQPLMITPAGEALSSTVRVVTPSGKEIPIASGETYFSGTGEPGIYEIHTGQDTKVFAVNIDPAEAVGRPLDPELFVDHFTSPQTETASPSPSRSLAAVQQEMEKRQRLWRYLLFGVMALLIGETFLANRTYR